MSHQDWIVKGFISEPIQVQYTSPPAYSKKPHCPERFTWNGVEWQITTCLSEWVDFSRRDRMAINMQPQHARIATQRGSWGVGRFYYDVQTNTGRNFRLYYDRAPADATDRHGHWVLLAELQQAEVHNGKQ